MELPNRESNTQSILRYPSDINFAKSVYDFAESHAAEFLLLSVTGGESFEVYGEDGHCLKRGDMVALNRNEVVSVRVRDSHFRGNLRVSAQGALDCLGTSFAPNSQYVIQAFWGEIVRFRFLRVDELIPRLPIRRPCTAVSLRSERAALRGSYWRPTKGSPPRVARETMRRGYRHNSPLLFMASFRR